MSRRARVSRISPEQFKQLNFMNNIPPPGYHSLNWGNQFLINRGENWTSKCKFFIRLDIHTVYTLVNPIFIFPYNRKILKIYKPMIYFIKKYINDNIILIDLFLFMYSRVIIFIVKITCHEL